MGIVENVDPMGCWNIRLFLPTVQFHVRSFQQVMSDISAGLKEAYQAEACVLIPGGTFAMEAIARQFGGDQDCLVVQWLV